MSLIESRLREEEEEEATAEVDSFDEDGRVEGPFGMGLERERRVDREDPG